MTKKRKLVGAEIESDEHEACILHKMVITTMYYCQECGQTMQIDVFSGICMNCGHLNEHATIKSNMQLQIMVGDPEDFLDN